MSKDMIHDIKVCDAARVPVIWFVTHEEGRAEAALAREMNKVKGQAWTWSLTMSNTSNLDKIGFPGWERTPGSTLLSSKCPFDEAMQGSPSGAISSVIKLAAEMRATNTQVAAGQEYEPPRYMAIIRDPHAFIDSEKSFVRALRDAARELRDTAITIVCISPVDTLPIDLQIDVKILYPGLPDKEVIEQYIKDDLLPDIVKDKSFSKVATFAKNKTKVESLVDACSGLTLIQVGDAIAESLAQSDEIDINLIRAVKINRVNSTPGLTYEKDKPEVNSVGGLAGLKQWMSERRDGFSQEARDFGLPLPKGILLMGPPGVGKSLYAKVLASMLDLPLIRLNPHDIKQGIVGATESNLRRVKDVIDAQGQCILWIDEFEKGFPKAGEHNVDGGTSDALLSGFLHWFQERKGKCFIVGTCNDITAMPPEFLRKGRWDELFFVDLPTLSERVEILNIHLAKINRDLSKNDVFEIAQETDGFSGAELEDIVVSGLWRAWPKRETLTKEGILTCAKMTNPLSRVMASKIEALREWASQNARSASQAAPQNIVEGTVPVINKRRKITSLEKEENN